jgi:hypothetical protein
MDTFSIRRLNLLTYIEEKFDGNRAAFCRAIEKNPNLINLVLTNNAEYARNIGEKLARDIEQRAGLATGWLDSPKGVGERKMVYIPITWMPWMIPDKPPLRSDASLTVPTDDPALRLRITGTSNLLIVVAQEPSMAPTIRVGDHFWVDLGVKEFRSDGVYVVRNPEGTTMLRRIQALSDGYQLSCDDKTYEPLVLNFKAMARVKIVGRLISVWAHSPL